MMTKVADRLSAHGSDLKNEQTSIPVTNTQRPLLRERWPVGGVGDYSALGEACYGLHHYSADSGVTSGRDLIKEVSPNCAVPPVRGVGNQWHEGIWVGNVGNGRRSFKAWQIVEL
jgi:hypothetical protein